MAGKRRAKVTRGQEWVKDPNKKDGPDNNGNGGVWHPSIQETLDLFKRMANDVLQHEAAKPSDEKYLYWAKNWARGVLEILPHAEVLAESDETRHALMVGIDLAMAVEASKGFFAEREFDALRWYRQAPDRGRLRQTIRKEEKTEFAKEYIRNHYHPSIPVKGLYHGYCIEVEAEKKSTAYKISAFRKLVKEVEAEKESSGST